MAIHSMAIHSMLFLAGAESRWCSWSSWRAQEWNISLSFTRLGISLYFLHILHNLNNSHFPTWHFFIGLGYAAGVTLLGWIVSAAPWDRFVWNWRAKGWKIFSTRLGMFQWMPSFIGSSQIEPLFLTFQDSATPLLSPCSVDSFPQCPKIDVGEIDGPRDQKSLPQDLVCFNKCLYIGSSQIQTIPNISGLGYATALAFSRPLS